LQLRIPPEQRLGHNLYRRGDGTLSYFFSVEDLRMRAEAAGFEVEEARYICVINRNKRTGAELRRVFVHGIFRKPDDIMVTLL
jgi:methyltransferase-like protein 6